MRLDPLLLCVRLWRRAHTFRVPPCVWLCGCGSVRACVWFSNSDAIKDGDTPSVRRVRLRRLPHVLAAVALWGDGASRCCDGVRLSTPTRRWLCKWTMAAKLCSTWCVRRARLQRVSSCSLCLCVCVCVCVYGSRTATRSRTVTRPPYDVYVCDGARTC